MPVEHLYEMRRQGVANRRQAVATLLDTTLVMTPAWICDRAHGAPAVAGRFEVTRQRRACFVRVVDDT